MTTHPPIHSLGEMSLMEHLAELRTRLIVSILSVLVGAILAFSFSPQAFAFINEPFLHAFPAHSLIGTGPAEAFIIRLKVSLFAGVILMSPILFAQLWLFVAPGLYAHEKRLLIPFVLVTTLLFITGAGFCHKVVVPISYQFFLGEYQSIGVTPTIRISEHLSMVLTAMFGFGAVFEMPVIAFFLARIGVITDRTLISGGRYAIVAIFVASAVLTPPDVLTQFLMAGPLLLLYGLSILIVKVFAVRREDEVTS